MSEKEIPLQAIFQTFEKISHGVRTYLSQFAYLTDNNYPSPTNGQPLFSLFSSFKANPLIASEHSTIFQPKEILNERGERERKKKKRSKDGSLERVEFASKELRSWFSHLLKDYQSGSDSMFEKENPLQSIFQTFEKISHGVRIYLSQFACLTNNNHPSPTNGRPLFSVSSSFKANPLIASEHSTLFQPKEILNEGKSATPVTKEELGRATWTFLHTLAAQYPDNPTRQQRKDVKELMEILSRMYPCKDCADHFKEILRANPVQAGSQAEFSQWLCHAHNVVNRSLGKLVFPCERVDARWGKMECEQRACDLQGTTTFFGDNMR